VDQDLTANQIRELFKDKPKLLDSWLCVGYRHWAKRQVQKASPKAKLNKAIKELNTEQYQELKRKLRKIL